MIIIREETILSAAAHFVQRKHLEKHPDQLLVEFLLDRICQVCQYIAQNQGKRNELVSELFSNLLHSTMYMLTGDSRVKRSKLLEYFQNSLDKNMQQINEISSTIFTHAANVEHSVVWAHLLWLLNYSPPL